MEQHLREFHGETDLPAFNEIATFNSNTVGESAVSTIYSIAADDSELLEVRFSTDGGPFGDAVYYDIAGLPIGTNVQLGGLLDVANGSGRYSYTFEIGELRVDSTYSVSPGPISGTYIAQNRDDSPIGAGWWMEDAQYLVEERGTSLLGMSLIDHHAGSGTWFEWNSGSSAFSAPDGAFRTLDEYDLDGDGSDEFVLEDLFGNKTAFGAEDNSTSDTKWLITIREDWNQERTHYTYTDLDSDGNLEHNELTSITDHFGRETLFGYDNGRLDTITDFADRVRNYEYHPDGRLHKILMPQVADEFGVLDRPEIELGYLDSQGNSSPHLMSYTNERGHTEEYEYRFGSVLYETTNFDGSTFSANAFVAGGLVDTTPPQTGFPLGHPQNPATPDIVGDFETVRTNERGYVSRVKMNEFGMVIEETDALGNEFIWERDAQSGAQGVLQTAYTRDVYVHANDVNQDGTETTVTTDFTYHSYSNGGQTVYTTYPELVSHPSIAGGLSATENYADYNSFGNYETYTDELNREVQLEYDPSGLYGPAGVNLTKHTTILGGDDFIAPRPPGDPDDLVYTYTYTNGVTVYSGDVNDEALPKGMLRTVRDPEGRQTLLTYYEDRDAFNFGWLKTVTIDYLGPNEDTRHYEYDTAGNITKLTDELGRVTDLEYDALDRLIQVTQPADQSGTRPITQYRYDFGGNLRFVEDNLSYVGDPDGNITEYKYDEMNRLIQIVEADPDDPGMGLESPVTDFTYDAAGNLIASVDPIGRMTSYQYDALNRLVAVVEPDVNGSVGAPWQNPANPFDVNADGVVDSADTSFLSDFVANHGGPLASLNADELPTLAGTTSWETYAYVDVDGDGDADSDDEYDLANHLSSAEAPDYSDTLGRPVTLFTYDASGNMLSETDQLGNKTEYRYDERGRLISTVQPEVFDDTAQSNAKPEWSYTYDAANQLISQTDPLQRLTEYRYDDAGRLTVEILPDVDGNFNSNAAQNELNPFDATGNGVVDDDDRIYVEWFVASGGRCVIEPCPEGQYPDVTGSGSADQTDVDAITEFLGTGQVHSDVLTSRPVRRYAYDNVGNLRFARDEMFSVTEYQYDSRHRLEWVISEAETGPRSQWLTTISDPMSHIATRQVVEHEYDDVGNLEKTTDYFVNTSGRETLYVYDNLDRLISHTLPDPDGIPGGGDQPVFTYTYDLVGNVLTSTDAESNTSTYVYDNLYRLVQRQQPDVDILSNPGTPAIFTASPTTNYEYDAAGQLRYVTDPLGRKMEYEYDGLGRVTYDTMPHPVTGIPDRLNGSPYIRFGYDLAGNVLSKHDAVGEGNDYWRGWTYDALYRPIADFDRDENGLGGLEEESVTNFYYDLVGNRTRLVDPTNVTTSWTYDELDRVDVETDSLAAPKDYDFDFYGNLLAKEDRRGLVTEYQYDNLHRNVGETWFNSSSNVEKHFTFVYDLQGNLKSSDDGVSGSYDYSWEYDLLNRVEEHDVSIVGLVQPVTLTHQYDRMNNRTTASAEINGVDDYTNQYGYDSLYRNRFITQSGVVGGNVVADKRIEMAYDQAGQLDFLVRYAGVTTQDTAVALTDYRYDDTGRLDRIGHFSEDSAAPKDLINGYSYAFDQANRITSMQVLGALYVDESVDSYSYNYRDELEGADYANNDSNEVYDYDANGNRTTSNTEDGNSTHTTHANTNRLEDDGIYTYTYDAEGNRETRTAKPAYVGEEGIAPYTTYSWDHGNRLQEVTEYSDSTQQTMTKRVTYGYDYASQLVSRVVDDLATQEHRYFVYQNGQIALQFDGDATTAALTHRYVWGPQVDQQLADEQVDSLTEAGRTVWPLTDHLGTVRDLVEYSSTGQVDETVTWKHRRYDAFGNVKSEINRGDFDGDMDIDADDIALLYEAIYNGVFDEPQYDLDGDGDYDADDVAIWVEDIIESVLGDANLDGVADGDDWLAWKASFSSGAIDAQWAGGDFDADGDSDGQDFIIWNINKNNPVDINNQTIDYIFGFTGRMFDSETGLQNNLNRWYDATVGRWISEDPISFSGGDTNLYRYVGNAPTTHTDPSGLFEVPTIPGPGERPGPDWKHIPNDGPGCQWHGGPSGRESLHDDTKHGPGKHPHWKWTDPYGNQWEYYPDEDKWRPAKEKIKNRPKPSWPDGKYEPSVRPRPTPFVPVRPVNPPLKEPVDWGAWADGVIYATGAIAVTGGAIIVSQLDSPAPGPADAIAAGMLVWYFGPTHHDGPSGPARL